MAFSLNVNVCTTGFWPGRDNYSSKMPKDLQHSVSRFVCVCVCAVCVCAVSCVCCVCAVCVCVKCVCACVFGFVCVFFMY